MTTATEEKTTTEKATPDYPETPFSTTSKATKAPTKAKKKADKKTTKAATKPAKVVKHGKGGTKKGGRGGTKKGGKGSGNGETKKSKTKSVRIRALEALFKRDMTAAQVQKAIGLGHSLKPTLDGEVEAGHLSYTLGNKEVKINTYHLTAAGKKFIGK